MSLRSDNRQNVRQRPDFPSEPTGEARQARREATESPPAASDPESPASTRRLMEEVCERENLKAALRQVKANRGSPGVDGMTVAELTGYLKQHWPAIREQLLNGTYGPKPVRRVEIPKPDGGGVRKLGIPTVLDRFVQQAVMQVLQRRWDPTFSDHSYGSTRAIGSSGCCPSAAVYRCRLRLGGRSRSRKILRSSQPRQTDGTDRQPDRGQAAAEAHPGIPECRGDGERGGRPQRGRDPARGPLSRPCSATSRSTNSTGS
jgi:hypothetical protein